MGYLFVKVNALFQWLKAWEVHLLWQTMARILASAGLVWYDIFGQEADGITLPVDDVIQRFCIHQHSPANKVVISNRSAHNRQPAITPQQRLQNRKREWFFEVQLQRPFHDVLQAVNGLAHFCIAADKVFFTSGRYVT